jgi:hypothetical protein
VVSQITRFETVHSDLAQAIAKMHVVGKELKDLATRRDYGFARYGQRGVSELRNVARV